MSIPVRLVPGSRRARGALDRHPPSLDLVHYARGDLDRTRAAEIRAHCERCPACGARLGALLLLRSRSLEVDRAM